MIFLVYADSAGASHLHPLRLRNSYEAGLPALASLGWRTMLIDEPVFDDPLHVSRAFGSIQIVMSGALRIGVTAGAQREWVGRAGDAFVFVDVHGDGHSAAGMGSEPLGAINIPLTDDWSALRHAFDDWPEDARQFAG